MLATHFGAGVPVSHAGMSTVRRVGEVKPPAPRTDAGGERSSDQTALSRPAGIHGGAAKVK